MTERRRAARDEVEAAYFTLLKAREELEAVLRHRDHLRAERRRLQRFVAEGDALEAHVDPRLRRPLRHTDELLGEALRARHRVIDQEMDRLPERVAAAEDFVAECEEEYRRLRR